MLAVVRLASMAKVKNELSEAGLKAEKLKAKIKKAEEKAEEKAAELEKLKNLSRSPTQIRRFSSRFLSRCRRILINSMAACLK